MTQGPEVEYLIAQRSKCIRQQRHSRLPERIDSLSVCLTTAALVPEVTRLPALSGECVRLPNGYPLLQRPSRTSVRTGELLHDSFAPGRTCLSNEKLVIHDQCMNGCGRFSCIQPATRVTLPSRPVGFAHKFAITTPLEKRAAF